MPGEHAGSDTWAIFVHGKGSSRKEALRILPMTYDSDLSSLVITYRNDPEAPASHDKRYTYGETEWEDLAAALNFATERGARRFFLIGYSMGGAIVLSLLEHRPNFAIVGVILDAPMLDLQRTVDFRAEQSGLPRPLTALAKKVAELRFGLDWDAYAYLDSVNDLRVPVLLFHGDADRVVPVTLSDELAGSRPATVRYQRIEGANHVRSWNTDEGTYRDAVMNFLRSSLLQQR